MKNWPNEPPAEQMPSASPCFSLGVTRMMAPSTGLKEAAARPTPLSTLPRISRTSPCIIAIVTMPST